jgi:hypothetical protein
VIKFEVGKTYGTRASYDYDNILSWTITGRTEKTITTIVKGKTVRRGITIWDGVENFRPLGSYSMCPVISADKAVAP